MILKRMVTVLLITVLLISCIGNINVSAEYVFAGEKNSDGEKILGSDAVFATNSDYYFVNGKKLKYSDFGASAYEDENGTVMVPCALLAEGLGVSIVCSGGKILANGKEVTVGSKVYGNITLDAPPYEKSGVYFVPAVSFVEKVLGKYAYGDGRGFVIVSSAKKDYSDSPQASKTEEDSDIISRFISFDRPSGEEIYKAVKNNIGSMHPNMFVNAERIENIKRDIFENPVLKSEFHSLMEKCEKHLTSSVVQYKFTDYEGPRLIGQFREVREVLFDLAAAFLITGGDKYLQRLWAECENVLSWEDWNIKDNGGGLLDASECVGALAFAYDVLYNHISNEQKDFFRSTLEEKYINFCISVLEGKKTFKITDGRMRHSNWSAVIGGGMFLVSMAFINDLPDGDPLTEKCKFLAEGSLRALEYPIGALYPDGAIHEGLEYWMFYVKNLAWAVKALCNMCGEDYGFLSQRGFKETINYALNIQSFNGGFNYLSTSGEGKQLFPELYIIADLYNDDNLMQTLKEYITGAGENTGARGLLFYSAKGEDVNFEDMPLDNYFEGEKLTTLRGEYDDENAAYVAILGGMNGTDSHFDKGSFIFEVGGERWISDIGGERKDVYGGYYHAEGWNLYRKRTEGHNNLVINPLDNTAVKSFIKENLNNSYSAVCSDSRYVGQAIGYVADAVKLESKEKGAVAVYDLTEVYGNQVTDYKRGFYLSDNRRALVVRDELTLNEANSNLYWGLHTLGEVKDTGEDYAIIEKNGKRLRIQFITNIPDFTIQKTDAQPLDTSMIRGVGIEGVYKEFSRDTIDKIMLSGKASGNVYIAAKLFIDGEENVDPIENTAISSWSIPDGECEKHLPLPYDNFKITSPEYVAADANGNIKISADVPYGADKIEIFVNEKKVFEKTDNFSAKGKENFFINAKETDSAYLNVRIDYIKGESRVSVNKKILAYTSEDAKAIIDKTFEDITPEDTGRDIHYKMGEELGLFFGVENFRAQGDGEGNLKLMFDGKGENSAGFLYKQELGIKPGNGMDIKWTLTTNDFIKMYVSAKDSEMEKTSPSRIDALPVYQGKHDYEMFLDGENYVYTVKNSEGEIVYSSGGVMKSNAGGFYDFHLKFYSPGGGSSLLVHKVEVFETEYVKLFSSVTTSAQGTKISLSRKENIKFLKVIYKDNGEGIEDISFEEGNEVIIEQNKNGAVFVLGENLMKPIHKCFKVIN